MEILATIAFAVFVFCIVMYQVLTNLIYICSPNEVLVFSGGKYHTSRGPVGYRIVKGGRALRIPFFEEVNRLDLTNMNIEVSVRGGFSKGGIPLNIDGIANVKIAGASPGLDNALQRLLGKPRPLVMKIAKETLEGYLRGVLATLTPEQVNEDTQTFERELREQAGIGFETLGLTLDNLKIQSVSDDQGYLTAMGRVQGAELSRDNRVAEAQRRAESLVEQAEARRKGELAKIQAQLEIVGAQTERRVRNAETAETAWVAEQEGQVKALLTRAEAELALQDARIEQAKHQLQAEVVAPAKAAMEAAISDARGDAAPILENGRAQADALRKLSEQWKASGAAARDIFLLQKLETILPTFLSSIDNVRIDNVTMLQGIGTAGNGGNGGSFPAQAVATVKALEAGGVDIAGMLQRLTGGEPKARSVGLSAPRAKKKATPKAKRKTAPPPRPTPPPPPPPTPTPPQPKAQIASRTEDLIQFTPMDTARMRAAPAGKARLIRKRTR